jgi:lipoprotein-anchoring transpeptidase ErfK/SrfK
MKIFINSLLIWLCFGCFAAAEDLSSEKMQIVISVSQCRLWLYQTNDSGEKILIREYIVATAEKGVLSPLGKGVITKIEFNPWWFPTALTREKFQVKGIIIGKSIPPNHKKNFLGTFKMDLSHSVPGFGAVYRIHGNNNKTKIGRRATGGCIRMHNEEGEELARTIKVGTEVLIQP